jgi:HEAT repeat protein
MHRTVRPKLWLALASSLVLGFVPACANHAKQSVALYESGDYAGAARAADEGLANHPDDDGLWQMRVRAALAQGDAAGVAKAYASYRGHRDGDDKRLLRDLASATLGQALASPSVKLKIAAINAVADAELQGLAELVAQRMGDDDDRVAASAAIAVLRGYPQAPGVADELLHSEDPEARRIAVDGVGKKVGSLAAADLEKAAVDPDPRVRRAAIRWLGQIKDKDAVEVLTRRMRDPDEGVRAASASALARIGIGNLEALGKQALGDRALAVRLAGIELIVAAHRKDELPAIAEADPDPMVAAEAAIAANRPDLAAKAIERAIAAEGWTIRAGAANLAVRALGRDKGVEVARRLLADKEPGVRLAAARVLAHGGDRAGAAVVFVEALANPELELQAAAELADQDDARGIAALDAAVRDARRTGDQRAAAAAAHRSAHHVTPGLVAALADPSGVVRVEAAAAIAMLTK